MKPSLLVFPPFLLLAPYALAQHVLRLEARPLDRIPETEGSVWDLSDAARSETGHADYTVYGDTLFSETIDGVRRWYLMRADSVGFIREESMRHSYEPYVAVATAATGMAGMESRVDTVRGEGFSYNTMRLLREGSYSSRGPVAGRLGTGARRTIGYDVHGWVRATGTSTRSGELYEYIRYADDAAKPRYNGYIARREWGMLNGSGNVYDYTYDGQGFLTGARHGRGQYSVNYAYDARGNLISMTRKGITDRTVSGAASLGVLDDVAASYSGNRLTSLTVASGAKTFSRRTGIGRTGSFSLGYDESGRLVSDGSRGISSIDYDGNGHALSVLYSDGSAHRFNRDGLGNLTGTVYMERCGGTSGAPVVRVAEEREYTSGGHVIVNGRLVMSRFGGGYFDASGKPHYYVTDWQGNNIGVVDRNGLLEQRTDYYPYGEPWLEPEATMSGQGSVVIRPGLPVSAEEGAQDIEATAASSSGSDASVNVFLFGDKERTRSGGLNEYRFPARDYVPGFPRFATIDPMCEKTPGLSPYAYCAGNPVMYIDPSGEEVRGASRADAKKIAEDLHEIFRAETFEKFRSLITNKGARIAKISEYDLAAAFEGVQLSEDQQALVDIVVNTINSKDKHVHST